MGSMEDANADNLVVWSNLVVWKMRMQITAPIVTGVCSVGTRLARQEDSMLPMRTSRPSSEDL